jgi:hypothetical protein
MVAHARNRASAAPGTQQHCFPSFLCISAGTDRFSPSPSMHRGGPWARTSEKLRNRLIDLDPSF